MGTPITFDPSSPQANAIFDSFVVVLVVCALIFALVAGLVTYALLKFRARSSTDPDPPAVYGLFKLEVGWTLVPLVIVAVLFVVSISTMRVADPPADRDPDVIVTGHQWWWEVEYPAAGVITANEIHIPVGQDVLVQVESDDVIHDFWVAELGRKIDAVPGHPNHVWIRSDEERSYVGSCAEFCGTQHAWMLFDVIAEPPAAYEAWLAHQKRDAAPPRFPRQIAGQALFFQHTCSKCHAVRGTAASARIAPDLTHIGSRRKIGAGVAANDEETMLKWLRNPAHFKPGSNMPSFQLNEADARAMTAYIVSLE